MDVLLKQKIEQVEKDLINKYIETLNYEHEIELEPEVENLIKTIGVLFFEFGVLLALNYGSSFTSVTENTEYREY